MDIKEFAANFKEEINLTVEMTGSDYESELANSIIEYIVDTGEVNSPELCIFKKTRSRITAYDYNDEASSLDLFYLVPAETLVGKVNNQKVQQGFNYLSEFYRECMRGTVLYNLDVKDSDEIMEVTRLIQSTKGQINQLRLYVITDGLTDPAAVPSAVESDEGDYIIEFIVWDMQRIYQQHNIRAGKEKVEIDFPTSFNTELQCLKMNENNPFVDAYLAIIPGITLAKIYRQYQQILLEKNVRTFLQFKGKVNKAIRDTLRDKPDMFFSYNNGISSTASKIELKEEEDGMLYITRLFDWQIVNGGQTTAAIAATLSDRNVDLNKVFVPMKVSVIRDEEHANEIIKSISISANSQTAIKNSDLSANDPYLIDLEFCSRSEWVPNGNNKPINKWYFERTRGQYIDQLAQLSGYNEKSFKIEYPKTQKILKTDIAKVMSLWNQKPYNACKGSEKNYVFFVEEIKKDRPVVTPAYYKSLIGKIILFKTIDSIVGSKKLGGYKANLNAYIMSCISVLSDGKLDMMYIWDHQMVQQEVVDYIEQLIPIVWIHLTESTSGNQSVNVGEWSKKVECWNKLKLKLIDVPKFQEDLLQTELNEDGSMLNETQQLKIAEAEAISPDYWFSLAKWAKANDELTPIERKAAFNFGSMRSRNKKMTSLKQALYALKIKERAIEKGFKE